MKSGIEILFVIILLIMILNGFFMTSFLVRNPKCNSIAAWGYIVEAWSFEKLEQFQ